MESPWSVTRVTIACARTRTHGCTCTCLGTPHPHQLPRKQRKQNGWAFGSPTRGTGCKGASLCGRDLRRAGGCGRGPDGLFSDAAEANLRCDGAVRAADRAWITVARDIGRVTKGGVEKGRRHHLQGGLCRGRARLIVQLAPARSARLGSAFRSCRGSRTAPR